MTAPDRRKVVVADDDDASAKMLELALRQLDVEVLVTTRSSDVLDLIREHRPVIAVLDVMMPELDGPTIVRRLREDPELSDTKVVLWSALDAMELARRAEACGADGALLKVAGPRLIVLQVAEWLDLWQP